MGTAHALTEVNMAIARVKKEIALLNSDPYNSPHKDTAISELKYYLKALYQERSCINSNPQSFMDELVALLEKYAGDITLHGNDDTLGVSMIISAGSGMALEITHNGKEDDGIGVMEIVRGREAGQAAFTSQTRLPVERQPVGVGVRVQNGKEA